MPWKTLAKSCQTWILDKCTPLCIDGSLQSYATPLLYQVFNQKSRLSSTTSNKHDDSIYNEAFRRSINEPREFWAEASEGIEWFTKWHKVIDNHKPPFTQWFVGGKMNTCYNALDRHVESGRGEQIALIHDSPITQTKETLTYSELLKKVSRFAGVLSKHGVKKGDRVLIYMPMIPESVIAMLATARLGAMHSLVFGGFAAPPLAQRINHAKAKVVVSANCGKEPGRVVPYKPILNDALSQSQHKPSSVIIYNRKQFDKAELRKGEFDFDEEMVGIHPHDCIPVDSMDPLYILYTSGTTGEPKAVVRPSGGHAVVLHWSMKNIFGVNPGEAWWAASDLGWVVGHSYICYAPLLHGNTSILYEGKPIGTPDPGAYFRVLDENNVVSMFTAPTAVRSIRREDPHGIYAKKYDMTNFRTLFVAGEHCDHETMQWARNTFNTPVLDHWWQTETGWPITSTCINLKNDLYPPSGVTGKPVPGWNVQVIDNDMVPCPAGVLGNIVVQQPLPPGSFQTLWENDERFQSIYFSKFPGYYDTMDAGFRDKNGNIAVMSRADDVINVAGHRLSTGHLEEAILELDDLAETAVVGLKDPIKGEVPLGFCVIKTGVDRPEHDILNSVKEAVRRNVGPVASFKQAILVKRLPKTRSGKVARGTLADMVNGKPFKIPTTIEDATVYDDIERAIKEAGILNKI